jgi:hypothetical protein
MRHLLPLHQAGGLEQVTGVEAVQPATSTEWSLVGAPTRGNPGWAVVRAAKKVSANTWSLVEANSTPHPVTVLAVKPGTEVGRAAGSAWVLQNSSATTYNLTRDSSVLATAPGRHHPGQDLIDHDLNGFGKFK